MLTPRGHRSNELQPRLHHKLYPTVLLMEATCIESTFAKFFIPAIARILCQLRTWMD